MGKEIAPRDEAPQKRDLASFDRALKYAEAALTKGPVIQMGTGEKGAGVGLIVDNRPNAAAPAGKAKARRDDESALPRRRTKVTTMYVRRGVPAGKFSPAPLPGPRAHSTADSTPKRCRQLSLRDAASRPSPSSPSGRWRPPPTPR